jgi:hypothetical protein
MRRMLRTLWSIATLLFTASPPPVTAGPELGEQAAVVEAPIRKVTVYSDRARIERSAWLDLSSGTRAIRLSDLPGAALLDTVRLSATNARVLYVGASPVDRERLSVDQVDGLLEKLERLTDEAAMIDSEHAALDQELALLDEIHPSPPVSEDKRLGHPLVVSPPDAWRHVLDFLDARRVDARSRQRALEVTRRAKMEEIAKLEQDVKRYDLGGFTDRRMEVVAILEGDGRGRSYLVLEYFVPGARWTPAYELHYRSDEGRVSIETAGMVSQATGEEWNEVELDLSTAIPGQGIEMPELLTWTLGEAKDFLPVARIGRAPQIPAPPPARPAETRNTREAERAAKKEVLVQRLAELGATVRETAEERVASRARRVVRVEGVESEDAKNASRPSSSATSRAQSALSGIRAASQRIDASVVAARQQRDIVQMNCLSEKETRVRGLLRLGESSARVLGQSSAPHELQKIEVARQQADNLAAEALQCAAQRSVFEPESQVVTQSAPSPPSAGQSADAYQSSPRSRQPGILGGLFGGGGGGRAAPSAAYDDDRLQGTASYRVTPLGLLEPQYYHPPTFNDPALPAVSAGGLDYVYPAAAKATIPSNGQKLKVPLAAESYPVSAYYEATPALEATAYLKATVINKSQRPVLLGPAAIFSGGEFVGEGAIKTTGPNGAIDFPLGADQDVRLSRRVIQQTKTEGVFSKDDTTTYKTIIETANYKKKSIRIALIEPLPKTRKDKIEIEILSINPRPPKPPDEDNIVRFDLEIGGGKKSVAEIQYRIKRPADWQLYQP